MKIKVSKCVIPRKTPFVTAKATQENVHAVIVQISDNGYTGIGETCPRPHINGATLDDSYDQCVRWASEFSQLEGAGYQQLGPSTAMGIESALLDLRSQQMGVPLHSLLNKRQRDGVSYAGFIGANVNGKRLERKLKQYDHYDMVRLKLSGNLDDDFTRIQMFRETLPHVKLWVDVNQAWDESVYDRASELEGVCMIEQPFAVGRESLNDKLRNYAPVMLDESVQSLEDMHDHKEHMDAVNLKLLKLGHYAAVHESAMQAEEAGLKVYCGGTTMTDIAAAYARHLEFAAPSLNFFTTGKPRSCVLKELISGSLGYDDEPRAVYPTKPGLGVTLDEDVLARCSKEYFVRGL